MRSKRRVIGIIIAVVFVFLMSTFLLSNNLIEAQETKDKQFTSIQVQKGDTLWKIAKKYMGNEYSSVDDYIEEVCQTNHIYDGKITEDMYLVIPYYKYFNTILSPSWVFAKRCFCAVIDSFSIVCKIRVHFLCFRFVRDESNLS